MTVNYPNAHWPLQGQVDGLPKSQVDPDKVVVMPYIGDETPRMREVVRNYYDCMLRLDACVGQLLQQLEQSGKGRQHASRLPRRPRCPDGPRQGDRL